MAGPKEGGYYPLFRSLHGSEVWRDNLAWRIYCHCKAKAKWGTETTVTPRGDVLLQGQLVTSLAQLSEATWWYEGRRRIMPSRSAVSRALVRLEDAYLLVVKRRGHGLHIGVMDPAQQVTHALRTIHATAKDLRDSNLQDTPNTIRNASATELEPLVEGKKVKDNIDVKENWRCPDSVPVRLRGPLQRVLDSAKKKYEGNQ